MGVTVYLTDSSRSTVAMRRRFMNRHLSSMTVGSRTEGQDAISSHEEGGASTLIVRWILIQRS